MPKILTAADVAEASAALQRLRHGRLLWRRRKWFYCGAVDAKRPNGAPGSASKSPSTVATRDLHSRAQGPENYFYEGLDVYRKSRILTNGSRLSQKPRVNQGIHSRVSGGSSA
jgi:hypothetical protein